jgi:hypothetical protein
MDSPMSEADFAAMIRRTGIPVTPEQAASLRQGYDLMAPLLAEIRTPPRPRAAEPAHIFIAGPRA